MTKQEAFELRLERSEASDALALRGTRSVLGSGGPRILMTGTLHGDEATAAGALWYLAERLLESHFEGTVTMIPCVNVLGALASTRTVPLEGSDINRCFPGRAGGSLAERTAAALVALLESHDALIDVHTAGWCVPFVILDDFADAALGARTTRWARAAGLPVIGEMPPAQAELQGLDRCWTTCAVARGKPALTVELTGFHSLDLDGAKLGAGALLALLEAAADLARPADPPPPTPIRREIRQEVYGDAGGLFEAHARPGQTVAEGGVLGRVRTLEGEVRDVVRAPASGLVLAVQPISAVHVGSWLATLAVEPPVTPIARPA